MSKLNKKLPKVSDICWMNSSRGNRKTSITMPFGGTIPGGSYFGFKQNSRTYGYQVQYKVKGRLKPSKALSTAKSYNSTDWKNVKSSPTGNWNNWNKANYSVDKKNTWYRGSSFGGKSLLSKGSYDRLEVSFRVRSINTKPSKAADKRHGSTASRTLVINCVPTVTIDKVVATADGGLLIYFNTNWLRGGSSFRIKDLRVGNSGNLVKGGKEISDTIDEVGSEEDPGKPFARFAGSKFNRHFQENETITFKNAYFRTLDGVNVTTNQTITIANIDAEIDAPSITQTVDDDKKEITLSVSKVDTNDDWDSVNAWLTCNVKGEATRIEPIASSGSNDSTRTFRFIPPLNVPLTFYVKITNNLGGSNTTKSTHSGLVCANNYALINFDDTEDGAYSGLVALACDIDDSSSMKRTYDSELPFGRKRPVAFFGEGLTHEISLSGKILEDGAIYPHNSWEDWLAFMRCQGLVLVRYSDSRRFWAAASETNIERDSPGVKLVSVSLEEVDYDG